MVCKSLPIEISNLNGAAHSSHLGLRKRGIIMSAPSQLRIIESPVFWCWAEVFSLANDKNFDVLSLLCNAITLFYASAAENNLFFPVSRSDSGGRSFSSL
jgi:hypothetical protein